MEHHTEINQHQGSSIHQQEEQQAQSSGDAGQNKNGGSSGNDVLNHIGSSHASVKMPMTIVTY